jgi:hypothetical protein
MKVPVDKARLHLLDHLKVGDLVVVRVTGLNDRGLLASLICFDDWTKRRDVEDLGLVVISDCSSAKQNGSC